MRKDGGYLCKKKMFPIEKTEKNDLYQKIIDKYRQAVKDTPDLSFKQYCRQYGITDVKGYSSITKWLEAKGIFVGEIKQEARDARAMSAFESKQRTGSFVSIRPEHEAMSGWRNTEIPRVTITLPGQVRLSLKKASAAEIISLISTYAEKGGR